MRTVKEHEDAFIHVKWSHVIRGIIFVAISAYASIAAAYLDTLAPKETVINPFSPQIVMGVFATFGYFAAVWIIATMKED